MYKILVLENKAHHKRANIINQAVHFPNCTLKYNGIRHFSKNIEFFAQFDLVVSVSYLSSTCNYIIGKCSTFGIKTLLLTDGIIEWNNMFNNAYALSKQSSYYHPIYHDYFGVMGDIEKEYFNNIGSAKSIDFSPNRVLKSMHEKKSCNAIDNLVLLTTANNAYFDEYEKAELINLLLLSQSYVLKNDLAYKCRIFDQELLFILKEKDPCLFNDVDTDFDECLDGVSHLITTPSTIVISAMSKVIPVCQLIYRNSPVFLQSGWSLNSIQNVECFFNDFISSNNDKINFQKAILNQYISNKTIVEQINNCSIKSIDNAQLEVINSLFKSDKFVLNFEPFLRYLNDIIKLYFPSSVKKLWVKMLKSLR
ncbi:hypothetical protein E2R68_05045 [Psychromonas sp. RZ22]|uniref:hypothetical protein n=1 Tax=Psychromonas algarum TaxID=2555643 RepID=UPI0010687F08|nr:hypothetical protein [Psychromonas sp. RZ22]TEW55743.1 hypothetical protein E2R68_05045 [Psychromonas sp. RZ22]